MENSAHRLDTLQSIELAEGVEVRLRIAGPLPRGGAVLVDTGILIGVIGAVWILFSLAGLTVGWGISQGMISLASFFMWWWYPVFFEAGKWGATPGKKFVGLRVVQTSGAPITFGQAVVRNFLRFADGMPYLGAGISGIPTLAFGLAVCVSTRRFQRLGDLAAGTVVIYDKPHSEPGVPAPPPMEPRHPSASLRPDEIRALAAFRDRAGWWSEGRRAEIADHAVELSGAKGREGVDRLMAMAHWLQERR